MTCSRAHRPVLTTVAIAALLSATMLGTEVRSEEQQPARDKNTAVMSSPQPAQRMWNPWNKESPEPYGYDVYTAPDLPLGHVNPEDPPATLPDLPFDPLATLTVITNVDRTSYSWYGAATVTADVTLGGNPVADCDSVVAVSAANPRVRAALRDDGVSPDLVAGDSRYSGYFDIGAGEGEARPTGSYNVTASAYRGVDSGSDASPSFSLYSVRRWTGISTTDLPDPSDAYTDFFVTENGAAYHHTIRDFGLIRSTSVTDAQIRIPILPLENTITNVTVSGSGVSNVTVQNNVIAFVCNLTSGTVGRVTIEFDAPSDLAATRIDRYQTGDIGLRDFRNGYLVWNRYIHTAIMGSGFSSPHGPGCIVDLHATDLVTGDAHTLDCMERVAVHLDNAANNDGTGTYQSNIKWSGDALSWLESSSLGSFVFRFASGGAYGLQSKVAVDRRVEFFADRRYFLHRYEMTNIDIVPHDFDFVWGREQWLYGSATGSNRQNRDRGILPDDPVDHGGEDAYTPAEVGANWFAAFDISSNYSIGVLVPEETVSAMPTLAHFLCQPALGNFTGEYPIVPSGSCSDMENIFFEKQLGVVNPGGSVAYEFYQWGGYAANRAGLTDILWEDADAVRLDPADVGEDGAGNGPDGGNSDGADGTSAAMLLAPAPNPFGRAVEIAFVLPTEGDVSIAVFDVQGARVKTLVEGRVQAGRHEVAWRGENAREQVVPAGVYFVRLDADGRSVVRKVVLER